MKIEKAAPKPTTTKYPTALLRGGSSPKKLSRPEYFSGCECEIMLTLIYEIYGGNVFFEKLIIGGSGKKCAKSINMWLQQAGRFPRWFSTIRSE